jgi:7-cyano-7-deazaguanine synthase
MKKAIVLLSGGLDSATCMAVAKEDGYQLVALSFDYGQRHKVELDSAKRVARYFNVTEHIIYTLDLRAIGKSALTDDIEVPKHNRAEEIGPDIPSTYVPARNIILLSIATAFAETHNAQVIFTGVNSIDYSGYPDCRPEFITSFEKMINLGTKTGSEGGHINIQTPLIKLSKKEIIQLGQKLGVDYSLTWSCYDPQESKNAPLSCGKCDSCLLRLKGFQQAGAQDPLQYAKK